MSTGTNRFCNDIQVMLGFYPGGFWRVCWVAICPCFLLVSVIHLVNLMSPLSEKTVHGKVLIWYLVLFILFLHSSSSSVSWRSLQRSSCSTTNTHHGQLSWATALECPHSFVCLLIWSTTYLTLREHSNRYKINLQYLSFLILVFVVVRKFLSHHASSTDVFSLTSTTQATRSRCSLSGSSLCCEHMTWDQDQRRKRRPGIREKKQRLDQTYASHTQPLIHIMP